VTVALEVRNVDVLFDSTAQNDSTSRKRIVTDRSVQEPAGYHVGLLDVNLQVNAGDCVAVLGESGSGKSSLLRTLAGLHPMMVGQVLVHGKNVSALAPERRSIVYLHQEPVLFPHLSVIDNIIFPMRLRGVGSSDALLQARHWLQTLQVRSLGVQSPEILSGGERHRVALARALCADPAVLLLDEPLASLDPDVRADVREALLAARAASGAAMVLVTHDLDDALAVGTQISAISWGSLSAPVSAQTLLRAPHNLETAKLLGVFSEIVGEIVHDGTHAEFRWIGGVQAVQSAPDGAAVACVRAHEVDVQRGNQLNLPVLTVVDCQSRSHEMLVTVRDVGGATAVVRVSNGAELALGDQVQITLTAARYFPARGGSGV
jgi:putative spermidine/putrescine transport system ATP-binding protein